MATSLVTNDKASLYGGVNQQAAEHRLETQVEECINAVPTVNQGLLKRNPTRVLDASGIDYDDDMYTYEYDRGLSGDNEEKYSVQITDDGMKIVNVLSGEVYSDGVGLTYEDNAEDYLQPFINSSGYSAVTVKDTTFLVNKDVEPKMDDLVNGSDTTNTQSITVYEKTIWFNKRSQVPTDEGTDGTVAWAERGFFAPTTRYLVSIPFFETVTNIPTYTGSTTTISVDGISFDHIVLSAVVGEEGFPTYTEYIADLTAKLSDSLDIFSSGDYLVEQIDSSDGLSTGIKVTKLNNVAFSTYSISITIPEVTSEEKSVSEEADYINSITANSFSEDRILPPSDYLNEGFFWIKGSNPTSPYSYSYTVTSSTSTKSGTIAGETTTEAAATALAADIDSHANFSAISNGSIVKVSTSDSATMSNVFMSDTFGNQASFAWTQEVASHLDLPKTLFFDTLVKVIGEDNYTTSYWLEYSGGRWIEALGYNTRPKILARTMPHILVRNNDNTFTLKEYTEWSDKLVGDDDSNPAPSFTDNGNRIKDIFFFKNRLGFITERKVIMSEVGEYGNFFRKTVATLLDSDRIDTAVDTTKAIKLEYATYLEDSLMLFSDKAQFKLEGGKILSPKDIQVSQTSAYEINKNIRPVFMNDKLFFVAKRGDYSAVMQYFVSGDGRVSDAIDVTSHVETYIPQDVKALSSSPINNMLFMFAKSTPDTIYVYKYLDSGDKRVQSAWFKWTYNGHIYGMFSLGKNLNILINRIQSSAVTDWVLGSGIWLGENLWTSDGIWYGSPDDLLSVDNFEIQPIYPQDHNGYFVDASDFVDDTSTIVKLTSTATSSILSYESFVQTFESVIISLLDDDIASYTITARTAANNVYVSTNENLVVPKEIRDTVETIEIEVLDASPVDFNGISCTYITSLTNELLYNNDFIDGMDKWTFTDWDITYGTVDVGSVIPTSIDLGEWVLRIGDKSQSRGSLKMKTCQVNSDDGSDFFLEVRDTKRDDLIKIPSRYTVDRKPMIYGDSKNVRLSIENSTSSGFKINSVSLEGNYNSRNRRV